MSTTGDVTTAASPEELVAAFLEAFVGGDSKAVGKLITADCVLHQPRWPLELTGRNSVVAATRRNEGTFTDVDISVERSVVADDEVAVFATARGRNVGPVRTPDRDVAPTGQSFEIPQFGHYRIEDGRIAEAWILADALGLLEQLGNLPTGPGALLGIALRQVRWRMRGKRRLE